MCDILKRLSLPDLTKQHYLSSLNDLCRLCRDKKKEELFIYAVIRPTASGAQNESGSSGPIDSTVQNSACSGTEATTVENKHSASETQGATKADTLDQDPSLATKSTDPTSGCNPIFKLNRSDDNEVFTMDDVFRW